MAEAEGLCDRVAIMREGRTIAVARPEELTASGAGPTALSVRTTRSTFVEEVDELPGTRERMVDGDYTRRLSDDPANTVAAILARLEAAADELIDLRVTRPSLKERFLELTRTDTAGQEDDA